MKKLISILLFAGLVLAGCSKPAPEPALSIDQETISFTSVGGAADITVTSNVAWAVSSTSSWLSVNPNHGSGDAVVTATAGDNRAAEGLCAAQREAILTFSIEGKSVKVKVSQTGEDAVFTVIGGEAEISAAGGLVSVEVDRNIPYRVSIPSTEKWIKQVATKAVLNDRVQFQVDMNFGDARQVTVTFVPDYGSEQTAVIKQKEAGKVFSEGDGTQANPYRITSSEDLNNLSKMSNNTATAANFASACYVQTADIDASGIDFKPLCQNSVIPFTGSYDGAGLKIRNLKINNTASSASGFVAYLKGGQIKGVNLVDADINSDYVYTGAIAGYVNGGSTISDCSVTGQVRAYKSGINVESVANAGFCGGIVGRLDSSTLKGCTVDANVTFYGKLCGGVVGYALNSTVQDCHFAKQRSLNIYYHFSGGVVGRARGENSLVKGCSFEGNYTVVGYVQGGIVGQMFGGTVEDCVFGSYAYMGSDKYFVGGICGTVQPEYACTVKNCSSYGTIRGLYSVGGIVGYTGVGAGATSDAELYKTSFTKPVVIKNCAFIKGNITATGANGSGYAIAGGILGWSHVSNYITINGCYSIPGLIQTTYGSNVNGVLCGICSYQNSTGGGTIENCYSAFTSGDFLLCNDRIDTKTDLWYAGVHIRCTQATTVKDCYGESSLRVGFSSSAATETGSEQFSLTQMKDGTLLAKLQSTADGSTWVAGSDGFPTFASLPADPHVKPVAKKRVSVIGDSISTFKGWIPGGYAAHYPASDGTLTLVNETYWYRLVYDYMKDAEFDVNIAYSGSTVTNTTAANYAAKYGTASNSWWHNSFVERFAACGGCGNPDIILIHGGTNDWAHNADPLAPNVQIRNDASNAYGGTKPSDTIMNQMYAVADAAKTRAEINALPDGTFCEAYIKLMCQIRERYPRCKVVCIIGDYLNQAVEQSTLAIAEHYGARCVNLFRVNGFNDLGGYTSSTFANKGTQPNMPKHDYAGDVSGCHPGSKAMEFIANKIYTELGAWLEE